MSAKRKRERVPLSKIKAADRLARDHLSGTAKVEDSYQIRAEAGSENYPNVLQRLSKRWVQRGVAALKARSLELGVETIAMVTPPDRFRKARQSQNLAILAHRRPCSPPPLGGKYA